MNYLLHPSILFALLSLFFAGINDVVFKRYSLRSDSRGIYIFGIGVIWTLLQIISLAIRGQMPMGGVVTILYGAIAGIVLVSSNILLLESLTGIDVSLGSMIYRLNTIGVVFLSVLFLNEPLGILKSSGIVIGTIAVLVLYQGNGSGDSGQANPAIFFGLAVAASLMRALYGVVSKAGLSANADSQTMILMIAVSWIVGGLLYAGLRERSLNINLRQITYSFLSGSLVFLIVSFLMTAIQHGEASIAIPVANMSFVIALLLSVYMKMETLSVKKFFAMTLAVAAIVLLVNV